MSASPPATAENVATADTADTATKAVSASNDVAVLRALVAELQERLRAVGIDPETAIIPLASVKRRLKAATQRLLDGDERAQPEFDKWEKIMRSHPEHIKALRRAEVDWEDAQGPANEAALSHLRRLFPADLAYASRKRLDDELGTALAKRVIQKPVLRLLTMRPTRIAKIHAADLVNKYAFMGLDLRELRAVYCAVPQDGFQNDNDGRKADWLSCLRGKIKRLSAQEFAGSLRADLLINRAYSDGPAKASGKGTRHRKGARTDNRWEKRERRRKEVEQTYMNSRIWKDSKEETVKSSSSGGSSRRRKTESKNMNKTNSSRPTQAHHGTESNEGTHSSRRRRSSIASILECKLSGSLLPSSNCGPTIELTEKAQESGRNSPAPITRDEPGETRPSFQVLELRNTFKRLHMALVDNGIESSDGNGYEIEDSSRDQQAPRRMPASVISELEKGMTLRRERRRQQLLERRRRRPLHECRLSTRRRARQCKKQLHYLRRRRPTLGSMLCHSCCVLSFIACYTLLGIGLFYSAPCEGGGKDGGAPLYDLATKGDAVGVSNLLARGNVHPDTPGTLKGVPRALGWLLKTETPLLQASRKGYARVVDALLKAGASVEGGSTLGPFSTVMAFTPLHAASIHGRTRVVNLLLKANASIEAMGTTGPFGMVMARTPLYEAARKGRSSVVDILLEAGAAVDTGRTTGPYGLFMATTPLHVAAQNGRIAVVDILLKAGASVDAAGTVGPLGTIASSSPLHRASYGGHAKVVDLLLKAGHPVNEGTTSGPFGGFGKRTPLHAASDAGHSVVVNMLLQAGAKDFTEL